MESDSLVKYRTNTLSALQLIDKNRDHSPNENLSTAMVSKADLRSKYSEMIDHYKTGGVYSTNKSVMLKSAQLKDSNMLTMGS